MKMFRSPRWAQQPLLLPSRIRDTASLYHLACGVQYGVFVGKQRAYPHCILLNESKRHCRGRHPAVHDSWTHPSIVLRCSGFEKFSKRRIPNRFRNQRRARPRGYAETRGSGVIVLSSLSNVAKTTGPDPSSAAGFDRFSSPSRGAPPIDANEAPEIPKIAVPVVRDSPKVGRNDPCPCGNGKKYKKCCGRGVSA